MRAVFVVSLFLIGLVSSSVVERQLCRGDCEGYDCPMLEVCVLDDIGCETCASLWDGLPAILDSQVSSRLAERQICRDDCEGQTCTMFEICVLDNDGCGMCAPPWIGLPAVIDSRVSAVVEERQLEPEYQKDCAGQLCNAHQACVVDENNGAYCWPLW